MADEGGDGYENSDAEPEGDADEDAVSILHEISTAVVQYQNSGLQCILIHPERVADLLRELADQRWWNSDTNEIIDGLPNLKDNSDVDGALIRVAEIPIFEDRYLPLYTAAPERKKILFFTRRLQDDGINLLQGWNG